jgi:hypothetical protein
MFVSEKFTVYLQEKKKSSLQKDRKKKEPILINVKNKNWYARSYHWMCCRAVESWYQARGFSSQDNLENLLTIQ